MGLFYNDTVTLYNRWYDSVLDTENWIPTLLTNCNLIINKGANISKSGLEDADAASLRVRDDCTTKEYLEPKAWAQLTALEKVNYYTFSSGEDFFVEGDTTSTIITTDNFYQYMRKNKDNVFRVTNSDRYKDVMPHFEVGGK